MKSYGKFYWILALVIFLANVADVPRAFSQYAPGGPKLRGIIKSPDGKPMEGVTVSIRGEGKTFVTTVYTNPNGVYVFPPVEKSIKYSLWAQAKKFQTARLNVTAASGDVQQLPELQLKPLEDYHMQLSGVEWMNSFPENTPAEKREKRIFANNCSSCHAMQLGLQNKFDAANWGKIISVMEKPRAGTRIAADAKGQPAMEAYKDEIVAFLTKVRGPVPGKYELKPLPRPTGDATQIVVTEYDLPRPEAPPEYYSHTGSDWMEGTPSFWEGRSAHDAAVGADGNVYFSDNTTLDGTIFKLDPRTGKVITFKYPAKNGGVTATHGLATDLDGNIWMTNEETNDLMRFSPKTEEFKDFPRAPGVPGARNTIGIDKKKYKGIIWSTAFEDGAVKLDPSTGQYTFFPPVTDKALTYGMTVDREGNGWYTAPGGDRVEVVDAETGKVSEVVFKPVGTEIGMEVTEADKENYAKLRTDQDSATPLHNCPRRLGADPNADVVWVALFCADKIAKIDIHTHQVTLYPLPYNYSRAYGLVVDNDHNVWINMSSTDMIARFNPATQKFTQYPLPTLATDVRNFAISYYSTPQEIFVAYNRTNKVARIQFRKASDMQ